MKTFGKDQIKAYVAGQGRTCPFCGSTMIEGNDFETGAGEAEQEMCCLDCHGEWIDRYTLTWALARTLPDGWVFEEQG